MAPRKPQPAVTAKTSSNAARVTRSKAKKTQITTSSALAIATEQASTYRVKRYRNGLLNLEKTPAHLVAIAKRNAFESPLLRLPAEIRNQIWSLAMGGQLVVLPDDQYVKGCAMKLGPGSYRHTGTKLLAAFHLPEVSRQVYSETALTSYQQNIFMLDYRNLSTRNSVTRLMAAQRRAITKVEIGYDVLTHYLSVYECHFVKLITDLLPNLEVIFVTTEALSHIQGYKPKSSPYQDFRNEEESKAYITSILKEQEGDRIAVEFEDFDTEDH
ncbi:beta transducin [Ascochyta clinopodiicola]|nr:beta transducin [Ascochyta clinopodiicola]